MDTVVKMPIGIRQLPAFRVMSSTLGDEARALLLWYLVSEYLEYRCQEGESPGIVPDDDIPMLLGSLSAVQPDEKACRQMVDELLVDKSKFFKRDGDGYICPRFLANYSQVTSREQLGGSMKGFNSRMRKLDGNALQLSLSIAANKFVDPDTNSALNPDERRRITRLIVACDNIFGKNERPPQMFSESLIHSAIGVVRRLKDEEIDLVAKNLALHKTNPILQSMNTERLLSFENGSERTVFETILSRIGT